MFLNINGFSQEIYNDVFLSNDSIIKNEILTNKKFSFKQIISISDNNGNILIFNNNRGVKIFNKKKKKSFFRINKKFKNKVSDLFSSQLLSVNKFQNEDCDIKIRNCTYLKVSIFDEKGNLNTSNGFFIPFDMKNIDESIENIISIYFSQVP